MVKICNLQYTYTKYIYEDFGIDDMKQIQEMPMVSGIKLPIRLLFNELDM